MGLVYLYFLYLVEYKSHNAVFYSIRFHYLHIVQSITDPFIKAQQLAPDIKILNTCSLTGFHLGNDCS